MIDVANYMDSLICETLRMPGVSRMRDDKKTHIAQKLSERFTTVMVDTLVDDLSAYDLLAIREFGVSSPGLHQKLNKILTQAPNLVAGVKTRLFLESEAIKLNPVILA
ncbi:MAG: hypothetical protein Q7S88_00725 [Candidatus Daviesbacteria bacterium]|nr:hypothetical protein [Candidatus Daviesbacteria bacterium]